MPGPLWTADDIRAWRGRMRWTQLQAAGALFFHVEAYKKLEAGTRDIGPRVRRLCALTEREHFRALYSSSGAGQQRQAFSSAERVLARLEAITADGKLDSAGRAGTRRKRLTYVSVFSGLESGTAALERLGSDAVALAFSETDPAANAVLRHRWPDVPRVGDIIDFDWHALRGKVDIVFGGSPCQAFSVAGRRLGIADPRGNLALHFLRAADAMQPKWIIYENVPGMLSARNGDDFEIFLSEMEKLGYSCAWRILDASHFGLPQRRKRLFLIAERSGSPGGPASVLDLEEGEGGDPVAGRSTWKASAPRAASSSRDLTEEKDIDWSEADAWLRDRAPAKTSQEVPVSTELSTLKRIAGSASGTDAVSAEAPTLAAISGGSLTPALTYAADMRHGTLADRTMTLQVGPGSGWSVNATPCAVQQSDAGWIVRRFSPLECLRLQGLDDDWLDGVKLAGQPLTDSDRYRLIGNSWAVPVAAWIFERLLNRIALDEGRPTNRRPARR